MSEESSRRDLSKTVLFGIGTLLVVEQSSLESQSRGCAKTPILMGGGGYSTDLRLIFVFFLHSLT